jgi:hypothetical protein
MKVHVFGSIWNVHGHHILSPVKIGEIATDTGFPDDIFGGPAADHEIRKALEVILLDKILDKESGAIASVVVTAIRAAVRIGNYGLHDDEVVQKKGADVSRPRMNG